MLNKLDHYQTIYLKANRNDEIGRKCFSHWVEISQCMKARIIAVIDKEELHDWISEKYPFIPIISSNRDRAGDLIKKLSIEGKKEYYAGCALITPFLHSVLCGYDSFWNIDADDMYLLNTPERCARLLNEAEEYADANELDMLQLDCHYTSLSFQQSISTFGVSYTVNNNDWIRMIEDNVDQIKQLKYVKQPWGWNVDSLFSLLGSETDLLKLNAFYINNLWFYHDPCITYWENEKMHFANEPFYFWNIKNDYKKYGVRIPERCVLIDAGFETDECKEYLCKNEPELYHECLLFEKRYSKFLDLRTENNDKEVVNKQPFWDFLRNIAENTDWGSALKSANNRRIFIWGAGEKGLFYKDILERNHFTVDGFIDTFAEGENVFRAADFFSNKNSENSFILISISREYKKDIMPVLSLNGFGPNDYYWPWEHWKFFENRYRKTVNYSMKKEYCCGSVSCNKFDPRKLYLFIHKVHNGEAGLLMSWITPFKKTHHIKNISIITTEKYESVVDLYDDYEEKLLILDEDADNLAMFLNDERSRMTFIFGTEWIWADKEMGIPFDITHTMFKVALMGMPYTEKSVYYDCSKIDREKELSFEELGIKKGKTIILCPYSNSQKQIPIAFWEKIVEIFKDEYTIYTNCGFYWEKEIIGTVRFEMPIGDLPYAVKYAGLCICARNGLADILALGQCDECMVIYNVSTDEEKLYAETNCLYVNGVESILYKNAIKYDGTNDCIDNIIEAVGKRR